MTAIDRVNVSGIPIPKEVLRDLLGKAVWQWYRDHKDEVIFTKKVWFASISLRVRDLSFLFVRIAGPEVF